MVAVTDRKNYPLVAVPLVAVPLVAVAEDDRKSDVESLSRGQLDAPLGHVLAKTFDPLQQGVLSLLQQYSAT